MAENTNPISKKTGLLGTLALLAIVLGVGIYGYMRLFGKRAPAITGLTPQEAAKVLPDETVMTAFIHHTPEAWGQLKKFQDPTQGELDNVLAEVLGSEDFSYEQDLQPWLGNVMMAFIPDDNGNLDQEEESLLLVMEVKDRGLAENFLAEDGETQELEISGVTVWETQGDDGPLFYGFVADQLLVAGSAQTLETAIATTQGEPSLASLSSSGDTFKQTLDLQNQVLQFYIHDYGTLLTNIEEADEPLPDNVIAQAENIESVVLGMGIEEEGLHFQAIANLGESVLTDLSGPNPNHLLDHFPANTLVFFNGYGLSQFWDDLVTDSEADSELAFALDQARSVVMTLTGLDLDTEVFPWMDGEFALGLVPNGDNLSPELTFGVVLALETSDRPLAEATLEKLDQVMDQQLGGFAIGQEVDLDGITVKDWSIEGKTALTRGWIDDDLLALGLLTPLTPMVAAGNGDALASSPAFLSSTSNLPRTNGGYFFMDLANSWDIAKDIFYDISVPIPPESEALIGTMESLAVASSLRNPKTVQVDLILSLRPRNPGEK